MSEDTERKSPPRPQITVWDLLFVAAIAALVVLVFILGMTAGRRLLEATLLSQNSWLFGFDTRRVMLDILVSTANYRSNIHPLFTVFAKPAARLIQSFGCSTDSSALILTSGLGSLSVGLAAAYGRVRGLSRVGAALLACAFAASPVTLASAAIVETQAWVILAVWIVFLIAGIEARSESAASLQAKSRFISWVVSTFFVYGITNLYAIQAAILFYFTRRGSRRAARAIGFAVLVFALGTGVAWWTGAYLNVRHEVIFLTPSERGGHLSWIPIRVLYHFLIFTMVAPVQALSLDPIPGLPNEWILSFRGIAYSPIGWLLAIGWMGWLGCCAWAARTDPDRMSRRLSIGFALCIGFFAVFHCFYYVPWEGLWLYTPAIMPALIALQVPLLARIETQTRGRRLVIQWLFFAFVAILTLRHARFVLSIPDYFGQVL